MADNEQCCGKCEYFCDTALTQRGRVLLTIGVCKSRESAWEDLKRASHEGTFCPDYREK